MESDAEQLWQDIYDIQSQPVVDETARSRLNRICLYLRDSGLGIAQVDRSLLLGYIAYHFGDVIEGPLDCENELQSVLQLDVTNPTATLYLGHLYFDRRDYDRARRYFLRVDPSLYSASGQKWRALKIRELVIACELHLGLFDSALREANKLLAEMRKIVSEDCAIPLELVNALTMKRQELEAVEGSASVAILAQNIILAIDRHGWSSEALNRFRREWPWVGVVSNASTLPSE